MRSPTLGLLSLALTGAALPLEDGQEGNVIQKPGLLELPLVLAPAQDTGGLGKTRRRRQVEQALGVARTKIQAIELSIGTPPQKVLTDFDTGSDKFFTIDLPSQAVLARPNLKRETFFDKKASTSLNATGVKDGIFFFDRKGLEYEVYEDEISIGAASLGRISFGIGEIGGKLTNNLIERGLWGMGPGSNNHIFDRLKEKGLIQSKTFSLAAADGNGNHGAVIFGGIDTKKFQGSLQKVPMIPKADGTIDHYNVELSKIETKNKDGSFSLFGGKPMSVTLDSGSSISLLPANVHAEMLKAFPDAKRSFKIGSLYEVDCARQKEDSTVDFTFSGATVKVPYSNFIMELKGTCYLSVVASGSALLGSPFLGGAYVVHDIENKSVYLANRADCGTNPVPIKAGPDGVPSVTGECPGPASAAPLAATPKPVDNAADPVIDGAGLIEPRWILRIAA